MQSLKKDKFYIAGAIALAALLPLFLLHLDRIMVLEIRHFNQANPYAYVLRYAAEAVSLVSDGTILLAFSVVLYLSGRRYSKKLQDTGKALILGLASTGILVQILKHLIGRARPGITENLMLIGPTLKQGFDSFPSGHTAAAFAFAFIGSQYFPRYRVLFYVFAVVVALSRIEVFFHFPSDVMAGAFAGLIVSRLSSKINILAGKW